MVMEGWGLGLGARIRVRVRVWARVRVKTRVMVTARARVRFGVPFCAERNCYKGHNYQQQQKPGQNCVFKA